MDNKIAGSGVLRGPNGQPLPPQYGGPKEPVPVAVLPNFKAEMVDLQTKFADLTADYAALKAEHDETLKDIGAISDANAELQSQHESLKDVHEMAMTRIATLESSLESSKAGCVLAPGTYRITEDVILFSGQPLGMIERLDIAPESAAEPEQES